MIDSLEGGGNQFAAILKTLNLRSQLRVTILDGWITTGTWAESTPLFLEVFSVTCQTKQSLLRDLFLFSRCKIKKRESIAVFSLTKALSAPMETCGKSAACCNTPISSNIKPSCLVLCMPPSGRNSSPLRPAYRNNSAACLARQASELPSREFCWEM